MALVRNAWAAHQYGCQPDKRNINENFTDVQLSFFPLQAPWQYPSRAGWDENGNMVIGGDSFKKNKGDDDSKVIW
jgi:hypothetical protein